MVFCTVRIVEKIFDKAHPILVQFAVHLRHKTEVVALLYTSTTMFASTMKYRDHIYIVSLDRNFGHPIRFILIFPISTHSKDPVLLLFVAHALVSDTFRSLVLPGAKGIIPNVVIFFGSFPVPVVATRLPFKLAAHRSMPRSRQHYNQMFLRNPVRNPFLLCVWVQCVQLLCVSRQVNGGGMSCVRMYQHRLTNDQYHL
jgi:hypothetical protein